MKNWYTKLSIAYKATFVSFIASIVVYLALIFAYFIDKSDIPNGLILGGGLGVLSYLLIGVVEKYDEKRQKPVLTVVVTILRYIVIAASIILSALSYYKWGYKIFNLFSLVGGYLIPLIVYIIITLVERKNV